MAASCRFAFAVHILAALAIKGEGGMPSSTLAASVNTNPVVVRRLLSVLRRAGFVCCAKGSGGGATLCCPPARIPLDAVYRAVEGGSPFSAHPQGANQRCPVGRQIEVVLEDVFQTAQTALESALAGYTLDQVVARMRDDETPPSPAVPGGRRGRKAA